MSFFARKATEMWAKKFISECTKSDAPRLASETYPADVTVDADISYSDQNPSLTYDCYKPYDVTGSKDCFVLIHGGGFVYGFKELDKCFGMHLARRAQIPVININYTLLPDASLTQIVNEIFHAINHAAKKYGYEKFHTTGDSAGGYLAYITAIAARNRHVAHDIWVFEKLKGTVESAGLICGAFRADPKRGPGLFFEKNLPAKSHAQRLPKYVYDLKKAGVRDTGLKVALITGEEDFCRPDNIDLRDALKEAGIDVLYYDAVNETIDGTEMKAHHVFPIAHPEWPMGQKAISLIADNATRKN